jgi:hypothetical protein
MLPKLKLKKKSNILVGSGMDANGTNSLEWLLTMVSQKYTNM